MDSEYLDEDEEDSKSSSCRLNCCCQIHNGSAASLSINKEVVFEEKEDGVIFANFFQHGQERSSATYHYTALDMQHRKKRDPPIHVTSVRDFHDDETGPFLPLDSMRVVFYHDSRTAESKPTTSQEKLSPTPLDQTKGARNGPLISWRDMDSRRTVGPTLSGYLQQSDIVVVSVKYTGDSYDTIVGVCKWLEEVTDTVAHSEFSASTVIVLFIWGDTDCDELRSMESEIANIRSYLGLSQPIYVSIASPKMAQEAFRQTVESAINDTFSFSTELRIIFGNERSGDVLLDMVKASSWEAVETVQLQLSYFPRAKKPLDMTFYKDSEPTMLFSTTCFLWSLLSALTASWPWFVLSWVRNKIILSICDSLLSKYCYSTSSSHRCTICCRLCCFRIARKKCCLLPAVRRRRSSWGKDKSFYALSMYPMKPIRWVSFGFFNAVTRVLSWLCGVTMSPSKKNFLIDCFTRVLYGIIAAGWWYFFAYTLVTGVLIGRVIVPLNNVSGFPLKALHYTIIYAVYLVVIALCYAMWSSTQVKYCSYLLLTDSLPIHLTYNPSEFRWENMLQNGEDTEYINSGNAKKRGTLLTTEWLRNRLRHFSERNHNIVLRRSAIFSAAALLVHIGMRVLLIVLGKDDTITLYHFTDIPGVKFPFFLVVGLLYAGTIFLVCFVSLNPLLKQKIAMTYMTAMLETTPPPSQNPNTENEHGGMLAGSSQTVKRHFWCFSFNHVPGFGIHSCASCCISTRKTHLHRLSLGDPSNIHAWLHLRQCLLKEFQDNFAEAKYVLATSIILIVGSLGFFIVQWIRTSSLFTNSTVLTDALYWACVLVYTVYYASTMENEKEKQLLLMTEAMAQIRRYQQADISCASFPVDIEEKQNKLNQCFDAYEASYLFMKEHSMVPTIFGMQLSRRTVKSLLVGVGGLAVPVLKAVMNAVT